MIVIELTYNRPLSDVDQHLNAHRDFLKKYYDKGIFIVSGAKVPREGGVVIADTSLDAAKELVKDDPFYVHEIADYRFIEFDASCYIDALSDKLKNQ